MESAASTRRAGLGEGKVKVRAFITYFTPGYPLPQLNILAGPEHEVEVRGFVDVRLDDVGEWGEEEPGAFMAKGGIEPLILRRWGLGGVVLSWNSDKIELYTDSECQEPDKVDEDPASVAGSRQKTFYPDEVGRDIWGAEWRGTLLWAKASQASTVVRHVHLRLWPVSGEAPPDLVNLTVFEGELKSVSFLDGGTDNGGDNEHALYENDDPSGWGDGDPITDPVWLADGPDAGTDPDKNEPVCYTRSKAQPPDPPESRMRVEVVVNIQPSGLVGQTFSLVGMEGSTEYFRKDGIASTGGDETVSVVASVALPTTVGKLSKTFQWKAVFDDPPSEHSIGSSTHTMYVVYDAPIVNVEAQQNRPTPQRLDFSIAGVAAGESDKVTICDKIVEKVRDMTGDSGGPMAEDPRWEFYARPPDRDVDCHHRAALAASAFGVVGIQGVVHRVFATCHPVPPAPPGLPENSTTNDYVSGYTDDRVKFRFHEGLFNVLVFEDNSFEGCVRVEDGSDDGNAWWAVWPRRQCDTAKALLIWFHGGHRELWGIPIPAEQRFIFVEWEDVPVDELDDIPTILGGPN